MLSSNDGTKLYIKNFQGTERRVLLKSNRFFSHPRVFSSHSGTHQKTTVNFYVIIDVLMKKMSRKSDPMM
jgi:hypothetical protein